MAAQDAHLEQLATKADLKDAIIKLGGWMLGVAALAVAVLVAYMEAKLG